MQLRYGREYNVTLSDAEVLSRFRSAYNQPWGASSRYSGDARDFWGFIVAKSLACDNPMLAEDIYRYYERPEAWSLAPGLVPALLRIRQAGIPICVVSNFDTRLKPTLKVLGILDLFDHVIVSAEVGAEKPSPVIFEAACRACGVDPSAELVVHVGDDRRNDVWGARDCGLAAWLWGIDVSTFDEIADRVISGNTAL